MYLFYHLTLFSFLLFDDSIRFLMILSTHSGFFLYPFIIYFLLITIILYAMLISICLLYILYNCLIVLYVYFYEFYAIFKDRY
jgi:hypothetical protein